MAKLVIFAVLVLAFAQTPDGPVWPDTWSSSFEEAHKILFLEGHNNGTWYYDFKTERQRIDRSNGHFDILCSVNGLKIFENTPCSQFVVDGSRYLYYPEKDECCHCCDSIECGMIKPTWMDGAEFLGIVSYNNQTVYKWNKVGDSENLIYETIAGDPLDRTMLRLYQGDGDDMKFNNGRVDAVPEGKLDLPDKCSKDTKCSLLSACRFLG